jgi:hypothetical protein
MFLTKLRPNEIFVFGSNLFGRHGAGAAKQALKEFGAVYGRGRGLFGRSYAFPTLDGHFQRLSEEELEYERDVLYTTCRKNPDKVFLLTAVGTGLAGYPVEAMRKLFMSAQVPENLIFPQEFFSSGWTANSSGYAVVGAWVLMGGENAV